MKNQMHRQKKEASNFYLKPIVQPDAISVHGVFFWIVRFTDQKFMTEPQWQLKMMSPNILWRNNNLGATVLAVYDGKRKSMNRKGMSVWMTKLLSWVVTYILRIKRKAAFMLKNPQDGETYPLYKNQWLSEALSCGTQPYLIGREGIPFHSGVKLVVFP